MDVCWLSSTRGSGDVGCTRLGDARACMHVCLSCLLTILAVWLQAERIRAAHNLPPVRVELVGGGILHWSGERDDTVSVHPGLCMVRMLRPLAVVAGLGCMSGSAVAFVLVLVHSDASPTHSANMLCS